MAKIKKSITKPLTFHMRLHEYGPLKPRIRVWSDAQAEYGQFQVISHDDAATLKILLDKCGVGQIIVHGSDCDAHEHCPCKPLTYGGLITE